jgi:hypothetical protein
MTVVRAWLEVKPNFRCCAQESGRGLPQSKTLARDITPTTLVGEAGGKIYSSRTNGETID